MRIQLTEDRARFFDGGAPATDDQPAEEPDPEGEARIVLERVYEPGRERFRLQRHLGYHDRRYGDLVVPVDLRDFDSDLTSVPWLFTWLVPRTGTHLPAALLHDAFYDRLVSGHEISDEIVGGATDERVEAPPGPLDRAEADRIFRDAMGDTGTGPVRRWLAWSAVILWTMIDGRGTAWSTARRWWYRLAAGLTALLVLYLGLSATLDLFDVAVPGPLPWMGDVPWMGESLAEKLIGGLAAAIVVPLLLGLTWGRYRIAGWILGTAFAVLIHVTVALLLLTATYWVMEWLVRRVPGLAATGLFLVVAGAAAALVATWPG